MKSIAGTIALCVSFAFFLYLIGLDMEHSIKYDSGLYIFPIILLILSFIFFWVDYKNGANNR